MSFDTATTRIVHILATTTDLISLNGFYFLDNEDVVVVGVDSDGTESIKNRGEDYTLTGAGDSSYGNMQVIGGTVGDIWYISRDISITQLIGWIRQQGFSTTNIERATDKAALIDLQQQEEIDRSLKFPDTEPSSSDPVLPSKTERASKILSFDANGKPQASTLSAGGALENNALNIDFDPAGTGAETRTVEAKLRENRSLQDFAGVDPTGATDSTAGIQAAFDAISAGEFRVLDLGDTGVGGYYKCSSTLLLPTKTFVIKGAGSGRSSAGVCEFRFSQTDGTHCFDYQEITDVSGVGFAGPVLRGFYVYGNASTGDGIRWGSLATGQAEIADIHVRLVGGYCFYLDEFYLSRVTGVRGSLPGKSGLYLRGNSVQIDGNFDFTGEHGLQFESCTCVSYRGEAAQIGANWTGDFWAATTAYSVGDIVRTTRNGMDDDSGRVYRCEVAGTSGSTAPSGNGTPGPWTQTDGTVTWRHLGVGGLAAINGSNLTNCDFTLYNEAAFSTRSSLYCALDAKSRNVNVIGYIINKQCYVDYGPSNNIIGVNDNFLDITKVSHSVPNSTLNEGLTASNWTTVGASMSAISRVSSFGKKWVKVTHDGSGVQGQLRLVNDATTGAYQPQASVGDTVTCQFEIFTSREVLSLYPNQEGLNFEPLSGDDRLDNYNSQHNDLITAGPIPKKYKMEYEVLEDGDFGFQLTLNSISSTLDVYVTGVVWATNIGEKILNVDSTTVATDCRYSKGDVLSVQDEANAVDKIICTRRGFAPATTWATGTAYTRGTLVTSGSATYRCTVSGTSDASVSLTGTGRDITDGTCEWDFIENDALFSTLYP